MRIVRLPHYRSASHFFEGITTLPRFNLLDGKAPWRSTKNAIDEALWREWIGEGNVQHKPDPYYISYS